VRIDDVNEAPCGSYGNGYDTIFDITTPGGGGVSGAESGKAK
jgi:hypothetical protein